VSEVQFSAGDGGVIMWVVLAVFPIFFFLWLFAYFLFSEPHESPDERKTPTPPASPNQSEPMPPPEPQAPSAAGLRPSPNRPATDCPAGTYLSWPVPAFVVLLVVGLVGAGVGSGGSLEGLLLAAVLNPILWAAAYAFWCIGKIRCPHCRKSFAVGDMAKQAVGSAIECGNCRNVFTKPPG